VDQSIDNLMRVSMDYPWTNHITSSSMDVSIDCPWWCLWRFHRQDMSMDSLWMCPWMEKDDVFVHGLSPG